MVEIPEDELVYRFSRSGGPGGQNVNKVNTRVTLFFDVNGSGVFSEAEKGRILRRLRTRADKKGVVHVVCQKCRTQKANREGAYERLRGLLEESLRKRRVRKKTKVPAYAREKRLAKKKRRGELKRQRSEPIED
jgi:ribosome-associated protein